MSDGQDCCCATGVPTLIFACAGSSNVGQLTNSLALRLAHENVGTMSCLAGVGAHLSGFVVPAKDCERLVVLDGCEHRCALKTLEHVELLPRLRDPEFTRILLVTLPEATPVHEAARLQSDLARAEIRPFGWVINQSLTPVATADPVLRSRQANEHGYIAEVCDKLAKRVALVPWMSEPPTGTAGLSAMLAAGGNR